MSEGREVIVRIPMSEQVHKHLKMVALEEGMPVSMVYKQAVGVWLGSETNLATLRAVLGLDEWPTVTWTPPKR